MDTEKIIDKIKKCLALSKSSNPHEAANALRQAQKLMEMHNIDALDISMADVHENKVKASNVSIVDWESELSAIVANAFGCIRYSQHSHIFNGNCKVVKVHHYVFVGVGAAADVAQYAFEVLLRQCVKARKAHIEAQPKNCKPATKTARGDTFASGWVHGVRRLVDRFAGNERNDELINQYLESKHPSLKQVEAKDRSTGRNIRYDSFAAGKREGQSARLDRGVGGMQKQERLA